MEAPGRDGPTWRKSTYTNQGDGNCVEFKRSATEILIRDSNMISIGPAHLSLSAWISFIHGLKEDWYYSLRSCDW
ncbi:DUF397 domain-containing protein [Streptomyces sp. NPDC020719]|uniref:DUF397 domain-containing protein n=1 Tax=Streptomyces sp. NPDC020719 TaxID=3154896 RepID=UPI0033C89ADC